MSNWNQTETSIPGARIVTTEHNGDVVDVFVTAPTIRNEIGARKAVDDGALSI